MLMVYRLRRYPHLAPSYIMCSNAVEGLRLVSGALKLKETEIEVIGMIPWEEKSRKQKLSGAIAHGIR